MSYYTVSKDGDTVTRWTLNENGTQYDIHRWRGPLGWVPEGAGGRANYEYQLQYGDAVTREAPALVIAARRTRIARKRLCDKLTALDRWHDQLEARLNEVSTEPKLPGL